MPYHIEKGHSGCPSARPFAVIKDADGENMGCHPTRTRAERQMRALYANEPAVSVKQFNAAIERARDEAFGVEEALIVVYEEAFREAGRKAEDAFRRATFIVAAGEWVPPPKGDLWAEGETSPGGDEREAAASAFGSSLGLPDLFNEERLELIAKRSGEAFDEAMNETLSDIINESFDSGASVRATADAIQDRFAGVARYRAEMLARTDLNTLANAASQIAAMKTFAAATIYKKWLTAHDGRVRRAHAHAEGQTVPLAQPFRVGGFELMYPGDASAPIALTANCFPANTEVVFPGLRNVWRRWYEGDVVEITDATGHKLTVTPNHPILRGDGVFVASGEIAEGDYLLRTNSGRDSLGAPDPYRPPAEIGEIYRLAEITRPAKRIRGAPQDFHGDGRDGDVNVVSIDGSLRLNFDPVTDEEIEKFGLSLSKLAAGAVSERPLERSLVSSLSSGARVDAPRAASRIRRLHKLTTFNRSHSFESNQIGLASRPWGQSEALKSSDDCWSSDLQINRHLQNTLTFLVSSAKVIKIKRYFFKGHVFNLDTGFGWYIANGIPVRNCRCTQIYEEVLTAAASTLGGNPMSDVTTDRPYVIYTTTNGASTSAAVTFTVDEQQEEETDLSSLSWRAVLALEGTSTDDGRYFASDAWSWRDLPLSLMAQTVNEEGHRGAEIAGRIDRIWKEPANEIAELNDLPDGVVAIMGEGEFDSGEFGRDVARMVDEKTLRGVSVDFGVSEAALYDPETDEVFKPEDRDIDMAEMMFGGKYHLAALKAEIGAATVVSFPAFSEASISMTASGLPTQITILQGVVLTAGAAGMAPLKPPRSWFDDPQLEAPTPLTVTKEGRVFGHAALFDTCHIGDPFGPGICVPPPRSGMSYSVFHHGSIECADGTEVPCGQVTLGTEHASRDLNWRESIRHYENTGLAVADVRAGEDRWGIWIAGGLRPTVSANKVREIKGGAISGDWRDIRGHLEFLAALVVNVAGFPIPRPEARVVASAGREHVLALVAAGVVTEGTAMGPREARRRAKVLSQRARKTLAR